MQVANSRRRSLSGKSDSKLEKHEHGKVHGLMWATVPAQQGTDTSLRDAYCCPRDAVPGEAHGETRPTDSAETATDRGQVRLNTEAV